jgi:hypothetical protein
MYINEINTTLSVAAMVAARAGFHFRSSIQHPFRQTLVIIVALIALWSRTIIIIVLVISLAPLLFLSTENFWDMRLKEYKHAEHHYTGCRELFWWYSTILVA